MATNWVVIVVLFCCVIIPVLCDTGCTSIINNDTCVINRTSEWQPQYGNIVCNASLPNCIVLCQDALSCSDNIEGYRLPIICPPNAESCVINCMGSRSCRTTKIIAGKAYYTEINIKANNAGRDMHIYTAYRLQINVVGLDADFLESKIFSHTLLSTDININCNQGEMCTDNAIYGRKTSQSVTLSCNGLHADCSNTNIRCPVNSSPSSTSSTCNVNCTMCRNMNLYSSKGTSNIHWHCSTRYACTDSTLICDENQDELIWNEDDQQWEFEQNLCGQPHTAIANGTKLNTVFVPKSNQSETVLNTMVYDVYDSLPMDDVGVKGMGNIMEQNDSQSTANHFYSIMIAVVCTVSSVVIFWCCFEWIKSRYCSTRREGQCDDDKIFRRKKSSVGAPPPRTDKKANKSHMEYVIKIPPEDSTHSRSETSVRTAQSSGNEKEPPRYNHVRVENVLSPKECIDADDSMLLIEGNQFNVEQSLQAVDEDEDDLKCTEEETSHLTTGNVSAIETVKSHSTMD